VEHPGTLLQPPLHCPAFAAWDGPLGDCRHLVPAAPSAPRGPAFGTCVSSGAASTGPDSRSVAFRGQVPASPGLCVSLGKSCVPGVSILNDALVRGKSRGSARCVLCCWQGASAAASLRGLRRVGQVQTHGKGVHCDSPKDTVLQQTLLALQLSPGLSEHSEAFIEQFLYPRVKPEGFFCVVLRPFCFLIRELCRLEGPAVSMLEQSCHPQPVGMARIPEVSGAPEVGGEDGWVSL